MAKEHDHSADDGTGFESCSSVSSVVKSSSLDMMKALLSSSITVWKKVIKNFNFGFETQATVFNGIYTQLIF